MLNTKSEQSFYIELLEDNPLSSSMNPSKSSFSLTESTITNDNVQKIKIDLKKPLYGMSPEQYVEGMRFHEQYFRIMQLLY